MRIPLGLLRQISTSFSRAFRKAFQEEYVAAKQNPKKWEAAATTNFGNMDLLEAKRILNLEEVEDKDTLQERADQLLAMNDKKNPKNQGIGSGYLQSKILNAKERIEYEFSTTESK